jgi:probable rRNA maturation factor
VLREIGESDAALSVVFVNDLEMYEINSRYLHKNYATDVLSFAYDEEMMEGWPFLGEIIIAPVVAAHHAIRYCVDPEKEIRKLLIHGILHLLGYDHVMDDGKMHRLQSKLMRRKFFRNNPALLVKKRVRIHDQF